MKIKAALLLACLFALLGISTSAQSIIATDTFNRGTENPLSYGGNWTSVPNAGYPMPQVVGVQVESENTSGGWSAAEFTGYGANWPASQWSSIQVGANDSTSDYQDPAILMSETAQTYYHARIHGPWGTPQTDYVVRVLNGTGIVIQSFTATINAGDVVKIGTNAGTISVWDNGKLLTTVVDNNITAGVPGFLIQTGDSLSNNTISEWQGGSTVTEGVPCGVPEYSTISTMSITGGFSLQSAGVSNGVGYVYINTGSLIPPTVGENMTLANLNSSTKTLIGTWTVTAVVPGAPAKVSFDVGDSTENMANTLTPGQAYVDHQAVTASSITNGVALLIVPNNFALGTPIMVTGTTIDGGALNGPQTTTSINPGYVEFRIAGYTGGNIAQQPETDAAIQTAPNLFVASTIEGQATGNLTCVSSFNNGVSIAGNAPTFGPSYAPGTYSSYTGTMTSVFKMDQNGLYLYLDPGILNGVESDDNMDDWWIQCPFLCEQQYQSEIADTFMNLPNASSPPLFYFTEPVYFGSDAIQIQYGIWDQDVYCINKPDFVPPPVTIPIEYAFVSGGVVYREPARPKSYYLETAICERFFSTGPWSCLPVPYYIPWWYMADRPHCTQHP